MFFPKLPNLDFIKDKLPNSFFMSVNKFNFIFVQHLLETTGSVLEGLIKIGANPRNIYVLGKFYSNNSENIEKIRKMNMNYITSSIPLKYGQFTELFLNDIKRLWETFLKNYRGGPIIILDDGGYCCKLTPYSVKENSESVIGIEQTTSGVHLDKLVTFPIIQLATSAVKKFIESPLITSTIVNKIQNNIDLSGYSSFGIVGIGNIGSSLKKNLMHKVKKLYIYDRDQNKLSGYKKEFICKDMNDIVEKSDFIFGCVGADISKELDLNRLIGNKVFASCSSGDIEFLKLLKLANKSRKVYSEIKLLDPVEFALNNGKLNFTILQGGFPVNFDGSKFSVKNEDIQITRALIFSALIQAIFLSSGLKKKRLNIKLDPSLQHFSFKSWIYSDPNYEAIYSKKLIKNLDNIDWISLKSYGKYIPCENMNLIYY